jgi:hypothetical protein
VYKDSETGPKKSASRQGCNPITGLGQAGQKERGARQPHKRLLYCVNVNRTSLDHLLLGKNADVDKNVECYEYSAASARCQNRPPAAPPIGISLRTINVSSWSPDSKKLAFVSYQLRP